MRALYGDATIGGETPAASQTEAMGRTEEDEPDEVDLADVVSESDQKMFRDRLKKMGFSDTMLVKLKHLDQLAESGAKFLSTSLQMTHRMYVVQLVGMWEEMDSIRDRLRTDREEKHVAKRMSPDERQLLMECYLTMIQESARGYNLIMRGAEGMVRMMMAAGKKFGGEKKAKPGWGQIKSAQGGQPNA